jgi:hypothetical protein
VPYLKGGAPCPRQRRSPRPSATASTRWSATTSTASRTSGSPSDGARDYATAERLGIEFGEDLRLLADIGWRPDEDRAKFELTIPSHDLAETLKRLHDEAKKLLTESPHERQSRTEDEATNERLFAGLNACSALLVAIDERGGDSA